MCVRFDHREPNVQQGQPLSTCKCAFGFRRICFTTIGDKKSHTHTVKFLMDTVAGIFPVPHMIKTFQKRENLR